MSPQQECPPLTLHHRVTGVELSPTPHAAESRDLPILLALLDGGVDVLACGTAGIEGGGGEEGKQPGFPEHHRDGGYGMGIPVLAPRP